MLIEAYTEIAEQTDGSIKTFLKKKGTNFKNKLILQQKLDNQIQRWKSQNETASTAEEIDFDGLCAYIRNDLTEEVQTCLFGLPDEKTAAIHHIHSTAANFATAQNSRSRERSESMIDQAISIIFGFYWNLLPKENRAVLSAIELLKKNVSTGNENSERMLKKNNRIASGR